MESETLNPTDSTTSTGFNRKQSFPREKKLAVCDWLEGAYPEGSPQDRRKPLAQIAKRLGNGIHPRTLSNWLTVYRKAKREGKEPFVASSHDELDDPELDEIAKMFGS